MALIGLTQFVAWLILTVGISWTAQQLFFPPPSMKAATEMTAPADIMSSSHASASSGGNTVMANAGAAVMINGIFRQLGQVNIPLVIGAFLFYFLGGYLLYGSLFAAIGAAADNETDTQQFMLPIYHTADHRTVCDDQFIPQSVRKAGGLVFPYSAYFTHCDDGTHTFWCACCTNCWHLLHF